MQIELCDPYIHYQKLYIIRQFIAMSDAFHSYTRKEIISWVQTQTKYKFQDLRNGVFFCKMLAIKFPEESASIKYNPSPISEYDCMSNLNLLKKVLNRKGLQLNLNVQTVLTSKNNFQLAKWFKSLLEPLTEQTQMPRQSLQTIQTVREMPSIRSPEQTPKKIEEKGKKKMESAQREKQPRGSLSKAKRLSMAKSQAMFFKDKKAMRAQLKIPINRRQKKAQDPNLRFYQTQIISKPNEVGQYDDMNEVLYERALQESIQSLSRILGKVKQAALNGDPSFVGYKKAIQRAIFTK